MQFSLTQTQRSQRNAVRNATFKLARASWSDTANALATLDQAKRIQQSRYTVSLNNQSINHKQQAGVRLFALFACCILLIKSQPAPTPLFWQLTLGCYSDILTDCTAQSVAIKQSSEGEQTLMKCEHVVLKNTKITSPLTNQHALFTLYRISPITVNLAQWLPESTVEAFQALRCELRGN